ncbi:MAG: hypothetical protein EON92_14825, partial [Burkholderiales bacterium]
MTGYDYPLALANQGYARPTDSVAAQLAALADEVAIVRGLATRVESSGDAYVRCQIDRLGRAVAKLEGDRNAEVRLG